MLGYACINLSNPHLKTSRKMIKKFFLQKGITGASNLALLNVKDLFEIFKWNVEHNILFFRITSSLFPWMSEYELKDLPEYNEIKSILNTAGTYANKYNLRLTFHPGPFNCLTSLNPSVINNTIKELEQHSEIGDLLMFKNSPYNKINIHLGGSHGNKEESIKRFCKEFNNLSNTLRSRLTIENDWKPSCYNIADLYNVYQEIGTPIVFDMHHHLFNHVMSSEQALKLAASTWKSVKPVIHYSESIDGHKHGEKHSEYLQTSFIDTFGVDVDIMIEAKAKDLALLNLRVNS